MKKTLAHEFLEIEAEDFEVSQECYGILEDILEKAIKKINPKSRPKKVLSRIGKILRKSGFRYKETDLLSQGLQRKEIDCRYYSLLYYSIGEELGLPLSIVGAPDHVFVRWNDEKNVFDWETTSAEKTDDKFYIKWSNIHEKSISNGIYLRNLTREEVKTLAFCARAGIKHKKNDLEGALADYDKAIELNPNDTVSYNCRGTVKDSKKDSEGALADYDKAIELDPNYSFAYNNRGSIKHDQGDLEGALADYDKAIELNPNFVEVYYNRRILKRNIGDLEGAAEDFEKFKEIKYKNSKKKKKRKN